MSNVYYALIDKSERHGEQLFFEFHCLERQLAESFSNISYEKVHSSLLENRSTVIELSNFEKNIRKYIYDENLEDIESSWFMLAFNREKIGIEARLYTDDNTESTAIYINAMERLSNDNLTVQLLNEKISLDNFQAANEELISWVLSDLKHQTPEFVSVYNVGQGNCNALCTANLFPVLYFDLGGGCYANSKTYTTPLRFCFTRNPSIILSHWDTDHYQTAKMNTDYLSKTWIVPKQTIGPVHLKFFLSITGSKLIWPDTMPELSFPFGKIIKCTGPSNKKNHSGLALSIDLKNPYNPFNKILLPADAAYIHIPNINKDSFDAVVATHHGANFDDENSPICLPSNQNSVIAYSYGEDNTYSHPKITSINAHEMAGWTNRRDTHAGHIAIFPHCIPYIPCGGKMCDLLITQTC